MAFDPAVEIARALDAVAVPAIALARVPVPDGPARPRCQIGGKPILPAEIEWPTSLVIRDRGQSEDTKVIGLPFLAQFDFAEIPDPSGQLPPSGMLFVFADIDNHTGWDDEDTAGKAHRVIYVPEVAADTPAREPPGSVVPVDDSQGMGRFYDPWATHDASKPRSYAAWSLEARVVETYPEPSRNDETLAAWEAMQARFAAHGTADPTFAEVWTISAIEAAYDSERTRRMTAQGLDVNGWRRDPGEVRGLWAIGDVRTIDGLSRAHATAIVDAVIESVDAALKRIEGEIAWNRSRKGFWRTRFIAAGNLLRGNTVDPAAAGLKLARKALLLERRMAAEMAIAVGMVSHERLAEREVRCLVGWFDRHRGPRAGDRVPRGMGSGSSLAVRAGNAAVPETVRSRSSTAPRIAGRGGGDRCLLPASGRAPDARRIHELAGHPPGRTWVGAVPAPLLRRRRGPAHLRRRRVPDLHRGSGSRRPRLLAHPGADAGRITSARIDRK